MKSNIAIVSGLGPLSEKVDELVTASEGDCVWFAFKPWIQLEFPRIAFGGGPNGKRKVKAVDPYKFVELEREFANQNVKSIFFTGDFPSDRIRQATLRQASTWLTGGVVGDEKCAAFFNATPANLSNPTRYFLALEKLLEEAGIARLLPSQIFPDLNVPSGNISRAETPRKVVEQLPHLFLNAARYFQFVHGDHNNRQALAAIVDSGVIIPLVARSTNELLRKYARRAGRQSVPILLKPPSVDFNPALDPPRIGITTVEECKAAGVRGIIVCAETTLIAQKSATLDRINELDMFLYAFSLTELRQIYAEHFPGTWAQNVLQASLLR